MRQLNELAAQLRILDATLVAIAEHGMVPSVQAARMTLAAAPEALQGAVAGMLDNLTLAALKLVSGTAPVLSNGRRTNTQS